MKIKVFDSSKVKKKPKKKTKDNLFIKVPTLSGVKKIIKASKDVFLKDKDDVILVLKQIIENCKTEKCVIAIDFGTGDAALTGFAYGIGWQIITLIYSRVIKNEEHRQIINMAFTADYEKMCFDYKLDFAIKIKIYKHLCLLLKAVKIFKRIKSKFV